jgi:hypothetical protein
MTVTRRQAFIRLSGAVFASTMSSSLPIQALAEVATPAPVGPLVYTYAILHPHYGEIGTFTDRIDRKPNTMRIDGRLRIAMSSFGLVLYRKATDVTAIMRDERLISLQSVTKKSGAYVQVRGEALGDQFVVNTTIGTFIGPKTILPSDPFILKSTGEGMMVSTDTGRISRVVVSGGDHDTVSVKGHSISGRRFSVLGVTRWDVWLDDHGIPVMFRIVENGTPIDFILRSTTAAGTTVAAAQALF